jgi:hypothetical protein
LTGVFDTPRSTPCSTWPNGARNTLPGKPNPRC